MAGLPAAALAEHRKPPPAHQPDDRTGDRTVSGWWIKHDLHGQNATLERLRVDRQLEEALVHGPDPLHLAKVFGLEEKTPSATRTPPANSWRPTLSGLPEPIPTSAEYSAHEGKWRTRPAAE
ncbi:hypothetical protein [Streptomyces sp. NPDC002133]|uniref:hypothetical protein n=1 Tax=Streptomyces sp. NPDC002133 TaxID=3154409 RepID=UPI0033297CE3